MVCKGIDLIYYSTNKHYFFLKENAKHLLTVCNSHKSGLAECIETISGQT